MTFEPGQSGNKNGRPKNIIDKRTQFRKLLDPHAEEIINVLVNQAKKGEPTALRLVIERLIPKIKSEPIDLALPEELTNEAVICLGDQVLKGIANKELTLEEGKELFKLIESHVNIIVARDLLRDFKILSAQINSKGSSVCMK